MAQIEVFKSNLLGGGARTTQFRVTITPPSGIDIGLDVRRTSFLCKASKTPEVALGEIELAYRGRKIYMTGDREAAGEWSTTFYMDTDYMIRTAIERWSNGMNDFADNTGVTAMADYATDLTVDHLDRDDTIIKTYIFKNAWPKSMSEVTLDSALESEIGEFECTWRYQHFEASGVNF